jgi:hypothetical protein
VLDASPLADIKNIRKVRTVIAGGKVVPHASLPEKRVLSVAKPERRGGASAPPAPFDAHIRPAAVPEVRHLRHQG